MSKKLINRKSRKSKKSKKLDSLFDIEKSLNYKRTLHENYNEIIKIKSDGSCKLKERYSDEILKFLDILTSNEDYEIRGTQTYKDQQYPLDIDILEYLYVDIDKIRRKDPKECYWLADKISNLVLKLQLKYPDIIYTEFKAGYDTRFFIDTGEIIYKQKKIKGYNLQRIKNHVESLFKKKFLTKDEKIYIDSLLVEKPDIKQWKQINTFFREKYILRWTMEELLNMRKNLGNGKIVYLQDAVSDDTTIKLDVICFIKNVYKTVTNIFFLFDKKKDKKKQVEVFEEKEDSFIYQDIFKYKLQKMNLKVLKRIWNLSCKQRIKSNIKILKPIFKSNVSAMGQISGELLNLKSILTFYENNVLEQKSNKNQFTILKDSKNIETLMKRFIIHLLHLQNRLYSTLDDSYNDLVTSKISEYFFNNSKDFWDTIKNGFKKKHINELKKLIGEIINFLERLKNDSIDYYFKQKKVTIESLISKIKLSRKY